MSLEQPSSKEWLEIVEKLTPSHILQINSRISYLQTNEEARRKAPMSPEEKKIIKEKRNVSRENIKNIFFGNMSRPEDPN